MTVEKPLGGPERVDAVAGEPAVTAWKRAARRHQHEWRQAHGWPPGLRPGKPPAGKNAGRIGSRIDDEFARRTNANFLTPEVVAAVQRRIETSQKHEMLETTRLYGDLLSSMPMCFNLFGPLAEDGELATAVVNRWFPDQCPADASVRFIFEWSPGRKDPQWLADRTAFDVAIFVTTTSDTSLIGIETKYHEHPIVDSSDRAINPRYLDVGASLCEEGVVRSQIWGTRLEQVWRDHLLAVACAEHADGWHPSRYVLVAPEGNPAWSALADEYVRAVPNAEATFEFHSIESLVDAAADLLPHAGAIRARYLDVPQG